MKELVAVGLCGALFCVVGTEVVRAQVAAAAPVGAAALEQQKGEVAKEIAAIEQKIRAHDKAIEEQPAVAAAKKASQAAAAAIEANAAYAKVAKERAATASASASALEKAKVDDKEYSDLRKQTTDLQAKRREVENKLREAAPDAQAGLKQEMAGLDKQANEINQKKIERRTVLNAKQEVADAVKAAAAAETAYQEFVKNNAEYAKSTKERDEAVAAYRKAIQDARAGDAEYASLWKDLDAARGRKAELDRKIAAAKDASKPAK